MQCAWYASVATESTVYECHTSWTFKMAHTYGDQLHPCMLAAGAQHEPGGHSNAGICFNSKLRCRRGRFTGYQLLSSDLTYLVAFDMICIRLMHYKPFGPADAKYTMYQLDLRGVTYSPSIVYDFDSASSEAMATYGVAQRTIARGELKLPWLVVDLAVVMTDTICMGVINGPYTFSTAQAEEFH